jgi:hypothetical protein
MKSYVSDETPLVSRRALRLPSDIAFHKSVSPGRAGPSLTVARLLTPIGQGSSLVSLGF